MNKKPNAQIKLSIKEKKVSLPDLSEYEIPDDYDLFDDENLDMLP